MGTLTQAGNDFTEFGLAVAGHTGDAYDLPGVDLKIDSMQRWESLIVFGAHSLQF
jgi:hypothetical protein